jgi:hypothetical protein
MGPEGFEPDLASLKDWQPHQKSNGPRLWMYLLCSPGPPGTVFEVGWKALESFSPGLQPGAKPSQLPAHAVFAIPPEAAAFAVCLRQNEKARCPLRDTGLFESSRRLRADVTCAGDTEILRLANLYSPNYRQTDAGTGDARVALRADSPIWQTTSYRSDRIRASAVKAS